MGGAEPVSEELKHQTLSAADVAVSLVDNTQETFGLAVAEAMAAGLPLVASIGMVTVILSGTVLMAILFPVGGRRRHLLFQLDWAGSSFQELRVSLLSLVL